MNNRKFLRIYIAEYESMRAWTGGEAANVFKSRIKPYDLFLLYQLGINPLLTEAYKRVIDEMKDQCILKDVTQMSDRDICQDMLNQINHYATADTQIYFLYTDRYFSEVRGRIRVGAGVSTNNTYRTGPVRVPESYRYPQKDAGKDVHKDRQPPKPAPRTELPTQQNRMAGNQSADHAPVAEVTSATASSNQPRSNQQTAKPNRSQGEQTGSNPNKKKKKKKKRSGGNPNQSNEQTGQTGKDQRTQQNPSQEKEKPALLPNPSVVQEPSDVPEKPVQAQEKPADTTKKQESKGKPAVQFPGAPQDPASGFMTDGISSIMGMMVEAFPAQVATTSQTGNENKVDAPKAQENPKKAVEASVEEAEKKKDAGGQPQDAPARSEDEGADSRKSLPPNSNDDLDILLTRVIEEQLNREQETSSVEEETPPDEQPSAGSEDVSSEQTKTAEEEPKPSWSEATRAQREEFQQQQPLTEAQKKDARLRALERRIFDSDHQVVQRERYYSPLEDHRASYVADLADRLIMDINRLVKGVSEMGLDFDAYMAMISTLVQSTGLEDFQVCWGVVYPGKGLKMSQEEYRKLQKEALYYVETCEQLYLKDQWDT